MEQSWEDRWPDLERLLDEALDSSPIERVALLELTRSKDPVLAADLERLLDADVPSKPPSRVRHCPVPEHRADVADADAEEDRIRPSTAPTHAPRQPGISYVRGRGARGSRCYKSARGDGEPSGISLAQG
jgi:hypothetical protein